MSYILKRCAFTGVASARRALSAALLSTVCFAWADARAETVSDALVRAYQSNPALNGERARQRATDENVPQAMAGYRPQVTATLGYACRP